MNKDQKGILIILFITAICIGMIAFFSTLEQNKKVKITTNPKPEDTQSAAEDSYDGQIEIVESYPYYGMREEDLNNCLLGKPITVYPCSYFDTRDPSEKIKYYRYGLAVDNENTGFIMVSYWLHNEEDDSYEALPSDNGYVSSGYFVDGDGVKYIISSDSASGVFEDVEEDTEDAEATTERKKGNGGVFLPRSTDDSEKDDKESVKKETGKKEDKGSSTGTTKKKKKDTSSATTEFDIDDHDVDAYYEDNKDEFESYEDACDAFEDDKDAWDDY